MGEKLKFLIVEDNGKFKANHIIRLDIKQEVPVTQNNDLHGDTETRASLRYEKKNHQLHQNNHNIRTGDYGDSCCSCL